MKPTAQLKKPEDFVVEEQLKQKFLKKFMRTGQGVEEMSGCFYLHQLKKRNLTTREAIKQLSVGKKIGYAGLKDKKAVTTQYVTVKNTKLRIKEPNLEVSFIKKINKQLSIGDLKNNKFTITLHNPSSREIGSKVAKINKNGFLNYFGPQRFGVDNNNHERGREILKAGESDHGKELIKFLIHAYQSWIFNSALDIYEDLPEKLPLVGTKTNPDPISKKLLEKDNLKPSSFELGNLSCRGGYRATKVHTKINYEIKDSSIVLKFKLPPGSYATVLLDRLFDVKDMR